MTPDQIFAGIAALLTSGADPDFDRLYAGGYDDRYPVTVESCELAPGTLEVEGWTLLCGTVEVPEDYDDPEGRQIALEFAIMKSRSMSPATDPLIYLHGGPAGGALQALELVSDVLFESHRATRDIITFDQRAAALSASSVVCYENIADHIVDLVQVSEKLLPEAAMNAMIAPCVEEILASGANLPAYNTRNNARDVRALMLALGHKVYNIYGISYGTKLALEVLRTGPEGVRSVVIDGVAPPTEELYDDLFGPYFEVAEALVAQCAADADCNAAYPDLRASINAAFERLAAEPVPASRGRAEITFLELFKLIFADRNNRHENRPITTWLPRIITDLAEGKTDSFDALATMTPPDRMNALTQAGDLTEDERALIRVALELAEAMTDLEEGARIAIERLKRDLAEDRLATSVAEAFEARSNEAALAFTDEVALAAMLRDYALLQTVEPSRDALVDWIWAHFEGQDRDDLATLALAMTPADIERTFEIVDSQATKYEVVLGGVLNLAIYACQEEVPYNTRAGFEARIDTLKETYPFFESLREIQGFYDMCEAFDPAPDTEFHKPVVSDVPVLILNGLLDVQTSFKWGAVAAETLGNARNYIIPEAGHGTIAYQRCPSDMSVAFINDPSAAIDASCIGDISVKFAMPDDPLPK